MPMVDGHSQVFSLQLSSTKERDLLWELIDQVRGACQGGGRGVLCPVM